MAVFFLKDIWECIKALCENKEYLCFQLLLREEQLLNCFCKFIMGQDFDKTTWSRLHNAYDVVHAHGPDLFFSVEDWDTLSEMFIAYRSIEGVPSSLRKCVNALRSHLDIPQYIADRTSMMHRISSFFTYRLDLPKIRVDYAHSLNGQFLGVLEVETLDTRAQRMYELNKTSTFILTCSATFQSCGHREEYNLCV
jgi:hypothetical protein